MLNLLIDDFMIELKDGAIKNVGPSNKTASAKLFDVESAEAREFGDKRVKLVCEDDEGNEVQVALFPEQVRKVARDIEALEDDSPVFEQV
jgi:L-asparaginase II